MTSVQVLQRLGTHVAAGLLLAASMAPAHSQSQGSGPASAAGATAQVRLRVVGGLANLSQYTRHEEPFWSHELPRLSGGRLAADIVPFDRAGLRGQEVLRLVQLGAVPFATALLSLAAAEDPELGAPDLAGLNADMPALKRTVAAYRPYLEKMLRQRYGAELLALYTYPAQVVFCAKPFSGLSDLAGRRVRTSSPTQSDLIEALGGTPVQIGFAEMVPNLKSGNVECVITGAMSGLTIGLQRWTSHVHSMAINWGLAAFVANGAAWRSLPADMQALLKRELPRLEQSIWQESDRETAEGIACAVGVAGCTGARRGQLSEVRASTADERRRREIFGATVLPRWVQRCGNTCAAAWNETVGPTAGFDAKPR